MGNYNPKTANQFRWQDSIKIQKFIQGYLVVNDIDFKNTQNYITEDIPEAKKLVDMIRYCYENQVPLIIYDYSNDRVWNSTYFANEQNATLISYDSDRLYMVGLLYNGVDTLEVNYVQEEFLIADNAKTIFGQDITGTGNIELYRHQISLTSNTTVVTIEIISSNNLKVDSEQDLTKLTKAYANMRFTGLDHNSNKTYVVSYNGAIWRMYDGSAYSTPTNFSDRVTTI